MRTGGTRLSCGTRRRLGAATLLCLLVSAPSVPAGSQAVDVELSARPLPRFDIGSERIRFGRLDYLGGFSYGSGDGRVGGVSAIRVRERGARFLAVTDTGYWFSGRIRRDAGGAPVGFEEARMAPILNGKGRPQARKGDADAEGLAIDGDRVLVSFERDHRIAAFADPADPSASRPSLVAQPIPRRELRSNASLETIAVSPPDGPLGGATVVVAEQSIDRSGNLFAAILGRDGGIFTVKRDRPWHATDGAFLPDGDLLLLERRYEGFGRVGMRIRRLDGRDIRPGALVDGPVLMEADLGQEIDNMEGFDVFVGPDGALRIALASDNNGSFFQRNLYLEFRFAMDAAEVTDRSR